MRARWGLLAMLSLGCTGANSTEPVAEVDGVPGPMTAEVNRASSWRPAWPVHGGVVVGGPATGLLLDRQGAKPAQVIGPCGADWTKLQGDGVLLIAGDQPVEFRKTPVVTAALVERAGWRLGEVVGDDAGIAPGGGDIPDPAQHRGIKVRSVRKIRRSGPPWQVVVGEWRDQVVVALTDKDTSRLLDGARLQRTNSEVVRLASLPVHDLDGDGTSELVVYADGDRGGLRAVYRIDLERGKLELMTFEERATLTCEAAP
ncbi:MAG: hypothetical protein ACI9MC_002798 [Kiritimatiellia bacterium]|jgi:hypothetical protein